MMNIDPHIFRAYDIRGVVETALTPAVVALIGQALGTLYPNSKTVIIARDGRISSKLLSEQLGQGLQASGCKVMDIGEVPTPVLYYATHELNTGAGVMITGSHNPPEYNGLKMVMDGKTLHGDDLQAIYECIMKKRLRTGSGTRTQLNLLTRYITRITDDVTLGKPADIAIDCGNGVAGPTAIALLERLGCRLHPLYCEVDGQFPNHHPDPSNPENVADLIACVRENNLQLGLAFDGDGDRLGVVDDQGEILWADRQMMLYARDVLSRKPGAKIIYDVKSSRHLGEVIEEAKGEAIMWKTGHSFIKNKMAETGAALGGEMSGHIFFKERWYGFDDALYSAARLLEILSHQALSSSELFASLPNSPSTPELTVRFDDDGAQHVFMEKFTKAVTLPHATLTTLDGVRADYEKGWGLVRASNTTPALVIRFEAFDENSIAEIQNDFRQQMLLVDAAIKLPF